MKIRVTMKDPDCLYEPVKEAVEESLKMLHGLSEKEKEALREIRSDEYRDAVGKWFEYGEYLTVEIDTVAETAVVVPR